MEDSSYFSRNYNIGIWIIIPIFLVIVHNQNAYVTNNASLKIY